MDKNPEEMTPEEMQEAFEEQFNEALSYVFALLRSDVTGIVRSVDRNTDRNLALIDRFIQAMYYGNLREGNVEEAVLGLMTGVRAAFLAGYTYKQDADLVRAVGPVSKKDLQ